MLLDFFPKANHCSFATQFETKFTYVKTSVLLISFYCHYTIDIDAMNDLIVAYSTLQTSRCIVHMDGTNRSETQKMTPFCHQKEYMLIADWRSLKHQNSLLSFGGPTAPSVAPQYRHPWGAVHLVSSGGRDRVEIILMTLVGVRTPFLRRKFVFNTVHNTYCS